MSPSSSERLPSISDRLLAWTDAHPSAPSTPTQGDSTRIHRLEQILLARARSAPQDLVTDQALLTAIDRKLPAKAPAITTTPPGLLARLIIGYCAVLVAAAITCGLLLALPLPGMPNAWPLAIGASIGALMALAPALTHRLRLRRSVPHPLELAAARITGFVLCAVCIFALGRL